MEFSYWIKTIIFMLAGIGCLLVGFELLSTNITKLSHKGLKKLFNKTQNNDIVGVGIGTATTAIMQSSAATTVMVVGFVNTGLMTLKQATAIIMGANIGTTITAQLAALSSFDFGSYAIGLAGVGVFIKMFAKKDKILTLGNALAGFGLLFLGLKVIGLSINSEFDGVCLVKESIGNLLSSINGWYAPIVLFFLGIILTALVQSSALITTIIITLTSAGIYIGAGVGATTLTNNVLYLILGTNIGTCITALLSSVGATTSAKRASMIHLLFNTAGAVVFILIFIFIPHFMELTFVKWFDQPATQVAMFHTFFNVVCTFIFLPISKIFVKLATLFIKDESSSSNKVKLTYVDDRLLKTPSIAIHMIRRELSLMYAKSVETLGTALDGFFNRDIDKKETIDKDNEYLENISKLIIEYMVKLTNENLAFEDECTMSNFYKIINDILRIGEIGDNIGKYTRQMVTEDLSFSENVILQIGFMRSQIKALYEMTEETFISKNLKLLSEVDQLEDKVDIMRKELIDDHFDRLNKGLCKPQNSSVFVNLVNNLERAADHMTYIAYSVKDAYDQANKQ